MNHIPGRHTKKHHTLRQTVNATLTRLKQFCKVPSIIFHFRRSWLPALTRKPEHKKLLPRAGNQPVQTAVMDQTTPTSAPWEHLGKDAWWQCNKPGAAATKKRANAPPMRVLVFTDDTETRARKTIPWNGKILNSLIAPTGWMVPSGWCWHCCCYRTPDRAHLSSTMSRGTLER